MVRERCNAIASGCCRMVQRTSSGSTATKPLYGFPLCRSVSVAVCVRTTAVSLLRDGSISTRFCTSSRRPLRHPMPTATSPSAQRCAHFMIARHLAGPHRASSGVMYRTRRSLSMVQGLATPPHPAFDGSSSSCHAVLRCTMHLLGRRRKRAAPVHDVAENRLQGLCRPVSPIQPLQRIPREAAVPNAGPRMIKKRIERPSCIL